MSRNLTLDVSPPIHRGMDVLDRDAFRKSITILAAKVPPQDAGKLLEAQVLKKSLLGMRKIRSVMQAEDGDRLVLLRSQDRADLPSEALDFMKERSVELVPYTLQLDYDYWNAEDILASILPEELLEEAPSGFAAVGHIAHLNLLPEYLPYKHIIGQLIIDKNPHIRTVVNKLNGISNQFRVFNMEVLAGEPNFIVQHNETNCSFTFDFSEVYWNSRLHTEHARLVDQFTPEDVVADVFAGVGPFAIPAAKKGCGVFANDLNPKSYKYLLQNIADNKVTQLVRPSCEDGRAFIRAAFNRAFDEPLPAVPPQKISRTKLKQEHRKQAEEKRTSSQSPGRRDGAEAEALHIRGPAHEAAAAAAAGPRRQRISHLAMNLPDTAIEFLDAFRGVLAPSNAGGRPLSGLYATRDAMPVVHCYCFTRELVQERAEADIRQRVEERLGSALGADVSFYLVRSVAPNKEMYCISFRLPYEAAFAA